MLNRFHRVLLPPIFPEDEELTRIARVTNSLLLLFILVLVIYVFATALVFVQKLPNYLFILACLIVSSASLSLLKARRIRLACMALLGGIWLVLVVQVFLAGGPRTVAAAILYLPTIFAGLMLGQKYAVMTSLASLFASLVMVGLELSGHALPVIFPIPLLSGWVDLMIGLLMITVTINLSVQSFQEAIQTARDQVSERKKAEQALRVSEHKYAQIAQNIPGMVFQVEYGRDETFHFNYASPRGIQIMGLPADFGDSWKPGDWVVEEDRASYLQGIQDAIARHADWRSEARWKTQDGQAKWFLVAASPSVEDGTFLYNGVLLDISERKQAEAEVIRLNQILNQQVEDQKRELLALSHIMANAIHFPSEQLLVDAVLDEVLAATGFSAGMIQLRNESSSDRLIRDGSQLYVAAQKNMPENLVAQLRNILFVDPDSDLTPQSGAVTEENLSSYHYPDVLKTYAGVPINGRDGLYGTLAVWGQSGQRPTPMVITFLYTAADFLGVAIDNIDLYKQAEQTAILEERQRLARDLHDSVSQTLFSATALAETLPMVWEQDPRQGEKYIKSLLHLMRSSQAEMRTLLVELRPQALQKTNLDDLIRLLGQGFAGHTQAEVNMDVRGFGTLDPEVQVVFFRSAQESLHNITKYARASRVVIDFDLKPDHACLRIEDNGRGFEPDRVSSQHFGLNIMQERAQSIGAQLEIISQPGQGTKITLEWSRPEIKRASQ